ncbi:nucleotidyl transferase AbiEii/AbiGii toxin family protein [Sphaerochaeta sp. S2]|uniref:nucleotidyl transferase AbiEii/AbiGii toxin family protein n=1 Tax=Sphaerochaeta sp. S2 TaxID=2798868 RepID=UPI0018E91D0A|nr:nucleotidyl transferase AbiEii/AbiGii toxin family protein [Sphaerochaeta sp. S2]MBJ2355380.1 nucleotidyl transferase AbiEii/AbiGii toxin family protein [Sphaerochaeta sp. S2]
MMNEKSILQKLKNESRKKKLPYQFILQLFCQEEFLRRLSYSKHKNSLILKGGLFLFAFNDLDGRPTMDIDFLGNNVSNDTNEMKVMIDDIIKTKTDNSFIELQVKSVERITEQKEYPGIRLKVVATILNTRTPFDIDIGIGDVVVPRIDSINIPTQLESFDSPNVKSYTLESTIAEKLEAMFSRMEATSRMKDYYDIHYLLSRYNFDGETLSNAIYETFRNRQTECTIGSLERISGIYEIDEMIRRWNAFTKKTLGIELPFNEVVEGIVDFVREPIQSVEKGEYLKKSWNHDERKYMA